MVTLAIDKSLKISQQEKSERDQTNITIYTYVVKKVAQIMQFLATRDFFSCSS